jgi:hypothetical protein
VRSGEVDPTFLITDTGTLADAPLYYEKMANQESIKVIEAKNIQISNFKNAQKAKNDKEVGLSLHFYIEMSPCHMFIEKFPSFVYRKKPHSYKKTQFFIGRKKPPINFFNYSRSLCVPRILQQQQQLSLHLTESRDNDGRLTKR